MTISIEFQQINRKLFTRIVKEKMKWFEVKTILDQVSDHLFRKYVEEAEQGGFDFEDRYSLVKIMPEASVFVRPQKEEWTHEVFWDQDAKRMVNRADFEASYYKEPAVTKFVDQIVEEHGLKINKGNEEYKTFCFQVLQMLYRLDRQKSDYKEHSLYGGGYSAPSNTTNENQKNKLPHKTIREVVELYCDYKIKIDKSWNKPLTAKGYTENLNRIAEMFEYVSDSSKTPISEYDKETARNIQKILSVIPTNLKKKYPTLTLGQVIKKCEKGEIAITEKERMAPSTINNYAILINGLFEYAKEGGLVQENHFSKLKVKKQAVTERKPFTNKELRLFFNTELFTEKNFTTEWSWRYWVPIILMYTGARVEEICQLYLEDIEVCKGIEYFNVRVKKNHETGREITSVKNPQSERLIPIHPELKRLGLLGYVEYLRRTGETRLFPSLKNKDRNGKLKKVSPPVSKFFNENDKKQYKISYIAKCGITDETKVLYCLRHTVETLLINHDDNIEHDKIDRLLGHQVKSTGRLHYGKYDVSTLLEVVEKIKYSLEAQLPWMVNNDYNKVKFPWQP